MKQLSPFLKGTISISNDCDRLLVVTTAASWILGSWIPLTSDPSRWQERQGRLTCETLLLHDWSKSVLLMIYLSKEGDMVYSFDQAVWNAAKPHLCECRIFARWWYCFKHDRCEISGHKTRIDFEIPQYSSGPLSPKLEAKKNARATSMHAGRCPRFLTWYLHLKTKPTVVQDQRLIPKTPQNLLHRLFQSNRWRFRYPGQRFRYAATARRTHPFYKSHDFSIEWQHQF